jgi:hypothetical protein
MLATVVSRGAQRCCHVIGTTCACLLGTGLAIPAYSADQQIAADLLKTATPIKHVIGVNRSFDHVYGTYVPKHRGHILLRSADPTAHPRIFPEYFSEPEICGRWRARCFVCAR